MVALVVSAVLGTTALVLIAFPLSFDQTTSGAEQSQCQTFPETGKTVCGSFLTYWTEHGGVARQGLPISGEFEEVSDIDGKTYIVQYFERAVFEHHPENQPPYDVLLSLLGTVQYGLKDPTLVTEIELLPPGMRPQGGALFPQTGKEVKGIFLDYWLINGGPLQYGYPISNAFIERSQLDGIERIVQYFERAVLEYHPENQPPNDVQAALIGRYQFERKYPNGDPSLATPTPAQSPSPEQ